MPIHKPVLLKPIIDLLCPADRHIERFIDGTLGGGGHTRGLLEAGVKRALAFDLDAEAIAVARAHLARFSDQVEIRHGSYLEMKLAAAEMGWDAVDAILLDLGLSSLQLEDGTRGFAFRFDAPLDMRFDQRADSPTAADLLNSLSEAALADIFYRYGEERASRKIARAIVKRRPLHGARQLAALVVEATNWRGKSRTHPATRVFQALRIAVNGELDAVEAVLPMALDLLKPGGRLAVISFHSLEDRIVKRTFREQAQELVAPPGMASLGRRRARIKLINRKPIRADERELEQNPRARSAKLRVVEKLDAGRN